MLREWLEHRLTPCPAIWRDYGFLREQIAIEARWRRQRAGWQAHLEASRGAIRRAAGSVGTRRRCALIIGGGLALDLPLEELARDFETVVLADVVHRPLAARRARKGRPGVRCVEYDVTGVLREWYEKGAGLTLERLLQDLEAAEPGLPEACGGEPDLVVSANVASQLMLLPAAWLERSGERGDGFLEALEGAAIRRHLRWLRERSGVTVLLSDHRRVWRDRSGRTTREERVPGFEALRAPDQTWVWRVAPIPEYDRESHLEHEVAAWTEPARAMR